MYEKKQRGGFGMRLAGFAFCFWALFVPGQWGREKPEETFEGQDVLWETISQELAMELRDALYIQFIPAASDCAGENSWDWLVRTQTESLIPLYGMQRGDEVQLASVQDEGVITESPPLEIVEETASRPRQDLVEKDVRMRTDEKLLTFLEAENEAARAPVPFIPRTQRVQVDLEELQDYETLVQRFYTIDANTFAGTNQLNVAGFMKKHVSIDQRSDGPQILIYHTHSQEAFADSLPNDADTSIVGVGAHLAQILQEEYGYQVLHHTGQYDVDGREDAYGKSLPVIKQLLEDNPTIEVVIDLHRDQMPEDTKLVMNLDGRPTARFMFFNGLSRTRKSGDIDYLENENIDMNLATSFQMQLKCEEYYPGLARKIYLKGYRYNMHLCPRTLLVELGAQNNTVAEAMNACDPLAHVLHMVLNGE